MKRRNERIRVGLNVKDEFRKKKYERKKANLDSEIDKFIKENPFNYKVIWREDIKGEDIDGWKKTKGNFSDTI